MTSVWAIGIVGFILFIYFCTIIYVSRQIDPQHNKELLDSYAYSFAYYGAILFVLFIAGVAGYYGYQYNTGKNVFSTGSSNSSIEGVLKSLSGGNGLQPLNFETTLNK
jgi:Na+/proline symporter